MKSRSKPELDALLCLVVNSQDLVKTEQLIHACNVKYPEANAHSYVGSWLKRRRALGDIKRVDVGMYHRLTRLLVYVS